MKTGLGLPLGKANKLWAALSQLRASSGEGGRGGGRDAQPSATVAAAAAVPAAVPAADPGALTPTTSAQGWGAAAAAGAATQASPLPVAQVVYPARRVRQQHCSRSVQCTPRKFSFLAPAQMIV
jgi:hypothetical protein